MASAIFVGPNNSDPRVAIRAEITALTTITAGDLLHVGQIYRSRIRKRTFAGVDVNGAPFAPYANGNGKPFYFYVNGTSASGRTPAGRAARATASKNRFAKTGKLGVRTATGIKYVSYGAAKAAHGVSNVNLYGMQQHTHMLDTMMVKAGAYQLDSSADLLQGMGGGNEAFEQREPAHTLTLGFYGPEAVRARAHNLGTRTLPPREFFALNAQDMALGERAVAHRMMVRAQSGTAGPGAATPASVVSGPITIDDVGF